MPSRNADFIADMSNSERIRAHPDYPSRFDGRVVAGSMKKRSRFHKLDFSATLDEQAQALAAPVIQQFRPGFTPQRQDTFRHFVLPAALRPPI